MTGVSGRKPCIRCLIADLPEGTELAEIIRERIARIPEEERTDEPVYSARLARCRECELLHSGTCAACGCYVEIRAAKRNLSCPAVPDRWTDW